MPCAFIKDPATADSVMAGLTTLTSSIAAATRGDSAYDPITDTIVYPDVMRTRSITIGTTSTNLYLVENTCTNLLTVGTSERFDFWSTVGTITVTADTTAAPNGDVIAQTLNDTDAANASNVYQNITVANDSLSHTVSVYVLKTTGATAPTFAIELVLTGGSTVTVQGSFNTDTGVQQYGSNGNSSMEQPANALWWRFIVKIANNTSGNTNLAVHLYPAISTHAGSSNDTSATGSAICTGAVVEKNDFATSYTSNRNLLINSQVMGSTWAVNRCTVTTNSTANPIDGGTNAETIVEDGTASSTHYIRQSFTKAASAIQFTFSVFLLQGSRTWALLHCSDANQPTTGNGIGKYFNLTDGTTGATNTVGSGWTLDSSSSVRFGSWYRCIITVTSNSAATIFNIFAPSNGDSGVTYSGASSNSIFAWGGQLVYGASAQTYWAVAGIASRRQFENLTTNYAFGTTGTAIAVGIPLGWATDQTQTGAWSLFRDNGSTVTRLERQTSTQLISRRPDAGGIQGSTFTHNFTSAGVIASASFTWDATAIRGYSNGVSAGTDDTTLTPAYITDGTIVRIGTASNVTGTAFSGWLNVYVKSTVLPASTIKIWRDGIVPL